MGNLTNLQLKRPVKWVTTNFKCTQAGKFQEFCDNSFKILTKCNCKTDIEDIPGSKSWCVVYFDQGTGALLAF